MQARQKKSDTLEVRLSHATKQAFMARCRSEGRAASEVVREMIEGYLARPAQPEPKEPDPVKSPFVYPAAFVAAAALSAGVFAATAHAQPDLRKMFAEIDLNGDGAVTLQEFREGPHGDVVRRAPKADGHPPGALMAHRLIVPLTKTPNLAAHHARLSRSSDGGVGPAAFAEADRDRDGGVSFGEFQAHHRTMSQQAFATLDANRDDRLVEAEFMSGPHAAEEPFRESLKLTFARLDADRDGAVSRSEFDLH